MRINSNFMWPASSTSTSRQLTNVALNNSSKNPNASPMAFAGGDEMKRLNNVANFGGEDEYTKSDAIFAAWARENTIKLDGSTKEIMKQPENYVQTLEQNGASGKIDFVKSKIDFNARTSFTPDELVKNVDYIASRYAVMKEQIEANYSDDERASMLKALENIVTEVKEKLATDLANVVGGFFEENGVSGEKNIIHDSVLAEFDKKSASYINFIEENVDYAGVNNKNDAWLKSDSAYMASELRKATSGNLVVASHDNGGYSLNELEKLQIFTKEIQSYSPNNNGSHIVFGTEEEIGLNFAEVMLKGEGFNKFAGVSDKVKHIVSKSIDGFIENSINSVQKHLDDNIKMKKIMTAEVEKGLSPLDENAIYSVINKVKTSYQQGGDSFKALLEGSLFAKEQFDKKIDIGKLEGVFRYEQSKYFNNFFKNTDKVSNTHDILGLAVPNKGYTQKEAGIETIVNSWNNFFGKITSDDIANLVVSKFSVYG